MSEKILQISDDFWNIRGDFKIGGVLNIGTHASLVRRGNGKFVLLDAYTLKGRVKEQIDALTRNGEDIEAIINLHPFHTVHVKKVHKQFLKVLVFDRTGFNIDFLKTDVRWWQPAFDLYDPLAHLQPIQKDILGPI